MTEAGPAGGRRTTAPGQVDMARAQVFGEVAELYDAAVEQRAPSPTCVRSGTG
ncbi:hypothetical protein ABZ128_04575 [Streptomyces sp. NPDC006326]|uniref:hypothetical protein n=1 Tax=Streptomyces sp. NPDC006326 TaxID=3156752 RepID=UPI0033A6CFB9